MWIAKPLSALDEREEADWDRVLGHARARGRDTPLAQSLAWGRAIQAVGGRAYAVFSPDERVGGLLFSNSPQAQDGVALECVNGPLLDWENSEQIRSQLAMFATAAARLETRVASLSLRPRWLRGESDRRLPILPIEPAGIGHATTLKVPLAADRAPEESFTPRLRRTIRCTEQAGVAAHWEEPSTSALIEFVIAAQAFSRTRGFSVPPIFWFRSLVENAGSMTDLAFRIVSARNPSGDCGCQLLIALHSGEAHYLFGHQWRSPQARSNLSPASIAHRVAIQEAQRAGMTFYDFNGYLEDAPSNHPYAGVSKFKAQFGAELVRYEVPEFRIEI